MNKPNTIPTARDVIARLAKSLATLARCAEQIAQHIPPDAELEKHQATEKKPVENAPRTRGRPRVFITPEASRMRFRAHSRNSRRKTRAIALGKKPPEHYTLRTPKDMPPQCLRVGACVALGLTCGAVGLALDMSPGNVNNTVFRFMRHAGLTSIKQSKDWFDAMHADPTAYAPSEARRSWAIATQRARTSRNRSKGIRNAMRRKKAGK